MMRLPPIWQARIVIASMLLILVYWDRVRLLPQFMILSIVILDRVAESGEINPYRELRGWRIIQNPWLAFFLSYAIWMSWLVFGE